MDSATVIKDSTLPGSAITVVLTGFLEPDEPEELEDELDEEPEEELDEELLFFPYSRDFSASLA